MTKIQSQFMRPGAQALFVVLLMGMAIFSVISTSISNQARENSTEQQALCNDEFKRVITARAEISVKDNEIRARDDANLSMLVLDIGQITATNSTDAAGLQNAFNEYKRKVTANALEKQKLAEERAANPIPDIKCGASE